MPTSLEEPRTPGAPVVKRTAIGERFIGALVSVQQRDVMKRNDVTGVMEPKMKANNKARQELVVTAIVMPGTTAMAGIGDNNAVPSPGDKVRLILRGAAFSQWIDAKKNLDGLQTGDVVEQITEYGQAFIGEGTPSGPKLTTNEQINAVPRGQSVGVYGPLTLRRPTPAETEWAEKADAAYQEQRAASRQTTSLEDDEEPF
jgi:hypothetical protein